jgi:hypothetical protein
VRFLQQSRITDGDKPGNLSRLTTNNDENAFLFTQTTDENWHQYFILVEVTKKNKQMYHFTAKTDG